MAQDLKNLRKKNTIDKICFSGNKLKDADARPVADILKVSATSCLSQLFHLLEPCNVIAASLLCIFSDRGEGGDIDVIYHSESMKCVINVYL